MRRGLCLLTVALAALAAPALVPALAQSACVEPAAPTMPDGKTAARAEIIAAAGAAKEFVTKSDEYQNCLNAEYETTVKAALEAVKAKDKSKPPVDAKALDTERQAKILANQKKKEEVGKAYGATAAAYKQANPPAAK
jgi:hypothetical protein